MLQATAAAAAAVHRAELIASTDDWKAVTSIVIQQPFNVR